MTAHRPAFNARPGDRATSAVHHDDDHDHDHEHGRGEPGRRPMPVAGLAGPAAVHRTLPVGAAHDPAEAAAEHSPEQLVVALRRQAATVERRTAPHTLTVGMVSATTAVPSPGDEVISRLWDISVKPRRDGPTVVIANIVISDRPPNPDTSGMASHGGSSFHHESAWTWIERQVTQFVGQPLQGVVTHLAKYGLDNFGKMPDPGADPTDQMIALDAYFHEFLSAKAEAASGWLGPKGTHSSQGGKISGAIRSLQSSGWTKENIFKALTVSFEPGPSVAGEALWRAAQAHADAFYAANQQLLEAEGTGATINLDQHREVVDVIYDWDTQFWSADYQSDMDEVTD